MFVCLFVFYSEGGEVLQQLPREVINTLKVSKARLVEDLSSMF